MELADSAKFESSVHPCPACGDGVAAAFHDGGLAPTNSVLLHDSVDDALAVPRGTVVLAQCRSCGHVFNCGFDASLTEYSERYESTQAFSPTFNEHHRQLADDLTTRYVAPGRRVLEIGCGDGEFLALLCARHGNTGVGVDPAHRAGHVAIPPGADLEFVVERFSPEIGRRATPDVVICKMTLEHVYHVFAFMSDVRASLGDRADVDVVFQVPNGQWVLGTSSLCDVYYEHCSYFSAGTLRSLFERSGFEVHDTWTTFSDQYLMIAARPADPASSSSAPDSAPAPAETPIDPAMVAAVDQWRSTVPALLDGWQHAVTARRDGGDRLVVWGGGSKAVAFLTAVDLQGAFAAAVDVNPRKRGTFLAASAVPVISPADLAAVDPDLVIAMNPIYRDEIANDLVSLGLGHVTLCTVDDGPDAVMPASAGAAESTDSSSAAAIARTSR